MPFVRVEVCVLGLSESGLQVLLGQREAAPFAGQWALPGGVLRIDLDEDLDAAARRVMDERLSLTLPFLRQLVTVGSRTRDLDRAPWALSVVYRALVWVDQVQPLAGKRMRGLAWRPVEQAQSDATLAFDHRDLIALAVQQTRDEVDALTLPSGFVPSAFTLGELQALCERILGRALDKSSFRRKLHDRALVRPIEGAMKGGANRPAQVFELQR
ncbi:NUDIX hydrolase [Roseateles sp. BYS87W]|uniref:NUDIX domain-containing protein n=1 Tax=Pelomonas baiyunensis TaxID=3299026 RepID=A0ABW7H2S8_9BURK